MSDWEAPQGGGGSGAVSSVHNSDGTLTISPTTGAVVASIALGHANTWTAAQTFSGITMINSQANLGATGTTQGTAAAITVQYVSVTGAAGAGVILPAGAADGTLIIVNSSTSNTIKVYPNTGATIDGGTVNIPSSIPSQLTIGFIYQSASSNWITVLDAVGAGTGLSYSHGAGINTLSLNTGATITWSGAQTFSAITKTAGIAIGAKALTSGSPYSVLSTDELLLVTAGGGGYLINLPAASTNAGRKLIVIQTDTGAGGVTITPAGTDTIEGAANKVISAQYGKIGLISDGVGVWYDLGTGGGI